MHALYEMAQSVSIEGKEHTKKTMQKSKAAAISTANRNSQPDAIESCTASSVASINEFQVGFQGKGHHLTVIERIVIRMVQG